LELSDYTDFGLITPIFSPVPLNLPLTLFIQNIHSNQLILYQFSALKKLF